MTVFSRRRFHVFERDRFTCRYCGRSAPKVALVVDHVIAKANGGDNSIENLLTACVDCNAGKAAAVLNGTAYRFVAKQCPFQEDDDDAVTVEWLVKEFKFSEVCIGQGLADEDRPGLRWRFYEPPWRTDEAPFMSWHVAVLGENDEFRWTIREIMNNKQSSIEYHGGADPKCRRDVRVLMQIQRH